MALENGFCYAVVYFVNLNKDLYLMLTWVLLQDVVHRVFNNSASGLTCVCNRNMIQSFTSKGCRGVYNDPLLVAPLVANSSSLLCSFDHSTFSDIFNTYIRCISRAISKTLRQETRSWLALWNWDAGRVNWHFPFLQCQTRYIETC